MRISQNQKAFILIIINVIGLQLANFAYSAVNLQEDQTAIGNGNGVATPSFWQSLNGHNPAGLVFNHTLKIQTSAAKFSKELGVESKVHKESVAVLAGNGLIGMGAEWSKFNSLPAEDEDSVLNWGVAGKLSAVNTIAGFSAHYRIPNGVGVYDAGLLFDLGYNYRVGIMAPDFIKGVKTAAFGINSILTKNFDVTLDSAYGIRNQLFVVKPGLGFHFGFLHLNGAYGIASSRDGELLLTRKFTGAVSLRIVSFLLVEYEYQGLTQHRVGLTLRMN